ncbi:hypothetical protein [Haladaptatus salinisoli]|uniref:hypothetical protein n=1 Tax=Haladaptatus salinisoli TaxID=2884876 RepID=UPI001D0AE85D|nr:hypothetical protein [Haladaptatus salinisoli]
MPPWVSPNSVPILVAAAIGAAGSILGGIIAQRYQRHLDAKSVRAGLATEIRSHAQVLRYLYVAIHKVQNPDEELPKEKYGIEMPQDAAHWSEENAIKTLGSFNSYLMDDTVFSENANYLGNLDEKETELIVDYYQSIRGNRQLIEDTTIITTEVYTHESIEDSIASLMQDREKLLNLLDKSMKRD